MGSSDVSNGLLGSEELEKLDKKLKEFELESKLSPGVFADNNPNRKVSSTRNSDFIVS